MFKSSIQQSFAVITNLLKLLTKATKEADL